MTKVVIIGDMTLGETAAPPGFPGGRPDQGLPSQPGTGGPSPQPPIVLPPTPPGSPDQGLPPIPGAGLPPPGLPPGEVWPPLPPGTPGTKAYAIVAIPGVGYRYTVVDLPPAKPDQGLPGGRPGSGHRPDQGLPEHPEHKPVEPDEPAPEPHNRRR